MKKKRSAYQLGTAPPDSEPLVPVFMDIEPEFPIIQAVPETPPIADDLPPPYDEGQEAFYENE